MPVCGCKHGGDVERAEEGAGCFEAVRGGEAHDADGEVEGGDGTDGFGRDGMLGSYFGGEACEGGLELGFGGEGYEGEAEEVGEWGFRRHGWGLGKRGVVGGIEKG